jgi:WD40 repeat protein
VGRGECGWVSSARAVCCCAVRCGWVSEHGKHVLACRTPMGGSAMNAHFALAHKRGSLTFLDRATQETLEGSQLDALLCVLLHSLLDFTNADARMTGDLFFLTTGDGCVKVLNYPSLEEAGSPLKAHTAAAFCIELDPKGRYFATGGADALVSLWHATELICVRVSLAWNNTSHRPCAQHNTTQHTHTHTHTPHHTSHQTSP